MRMEEKVKEVEKVVFKLRTQAESKDGAIKDEESAREARLGVSSARCVRLSCRLFSRRLIIAQREALLAAKKKSVDPVTAEYNAVKEGHTTTQTALATAGRSLLQILLTGLAGSSVQSPGGGGYMGRIADARA